MDVKTAYLYASLIPLLAAVSACSDPAPPKAKGNMQVQIGFAVNPPENKTCNLQVPAAGNIGEPPPTATDPGQRVTNGADGARVSCKVSGSETYSFSGTLGKGANSFGTSGRIEADGTGTGTVTVRTAGTVNTLSTDPDLDCTFTAVEAASGRIWATYDCPGMINRQSPQTYCKASGTFVFENCSE